MQIEVINNDGDEKVAIEPVVAPKGKKKRLTVEERIADIAQKAEAAAKKARNRVEATAAKRQAKKAANKATRNTTKKQSRNALAAAVMNMARNQGVSLVAEDVKIPGVGAKMNHIRKYFDAAKKRYYTRTKKPSSIRREALQLAVEQGIPEVYVKATTRNKSVQNILERARKRYDKNTAKKSKHSMRDQFLAFAEQLGLTEKQMVSTVCVRKKAEKK